jgi:hypothetical protein
LNGLETSLVNFGGGVGGGVGGGEGGIKGRKEKGGEEAVNTRTLTIAACCEYMETSAHHRSGSGNWS